MEIPVRFVQVEEVLPDTAFSAWRDHVVQSATQHLLKHGEFPSTMFGVCRAPLKGPHKPHVPALAFVDLSELVATEESKDTLALVLPDLLSSIHCQGYVIVMDAYMHIVGGAEHAPQECLVISSEHLRHSSQFAIYTYTRDQHGKVDAPPQRLPDQFDHEHITGKFVNLLRTAQHAAGAEA